MRKFLVGLLVGAGFGVITALPAWAASNTDIGPGQSISSSSDVDITALGNVQITGQSTITAGAAVVITAGSTGSSISTSTVSGGTGVSISEVGSGSISGSTVGTNAGALTLTDTGAPGQAFTVTSSDLTAGGDEINGLEAVEVTAQGGCGANLAVITALEEIPVGGDFQLSFSNGASSGCTTAALSIGSGSTDAVVASGPGAQNVVEEGTQAGAVTTVTDGTPSVSLVFSSSLPLAAITSPTGGGTYGLGQVVPTSFSCNGTCQDSNGVGGGAGDLGTSLAGPQTYAVTATANGVSNSNAISYTVEPITPGLGLAGTPETGDNTYDVTLTVPAAGPAPSEAVTVSDSGGGSCSTGALSGSGATYTGSCTIDSETAGETVSASYPSGDPNYTSATSSSSLTVGPPTIALSLSGPPELGGNTYGIPAGGTATITATVTEGPTLTGVIVSWAVTGQNEGVTGTCTNDEGADPTCATDDNGQVNFTYTDVNGAGEDTVGASVSVSGETGDGTANILWAPPPVVTAGASVTYTGGGLPVALDAGLAVSDAWSTTLAGATVSISSGFLSGDTLSFTDQSSITGAYNASSGVLTLSGPGTVADYQTALDSVTYSFSGADPTDGATDNSRTIEWSVSDAIASSPSATSTVDVSAAPCSPGTYSTTGTGPSCTTTPAGSFDAGSGNTSATPCPAGTYNPGTGATSASACLTTPAGSYDPGTGNVAAIPCPAGTTSTSPGATSCTPVVPPTSLSLVAFPPGPLPSGSLVAYLAEVSKGSAAGTLTGTVSFTDDGAAIPGCSKLHPFLGLAACVTGYPTAGSYVIVATYSGDPGFAGSSATLTQVIFQVPSITSANHATATTGTSFSFQVTASGHPAPTFSETGALPNGVSFSDGVLSGAPAPGTGGSYPITIIATNPYGVSHQSFTLTVDQPPAITSANHDSATLGRSFSFQVTASGYPAPTFTETGALPKGVSFSSRGLLSGVPQSAGTFNITVTAMSSAGTAQQSFALTT